MSTTTHLMTAEELMHLDDEPNRHELIRGELLRVGIRSEGYRPDPPDLAIEVLSVSNRKAQVERKTSLWLELGARAVWNVDPRKRTVEVVRADGKRKLFHETDELVDDAVRGFSVQVSEIFA